MPGRLAGTTVLVTGAARRIGRVSAALRSRGANLVVYDARSAEPASSA